MITKLTLKHLIITQHSKNPQKVADTIALLESQPKLLEKPLKIGGDIALTILENLSSRNEFDKGVLLANYLIQYGKLLALDEIKSQKPEL